MPPVALASAAFVVAFHVEPHPRALRVKPRAPCAPLVPHAAGRGSSMLACRLTAGKQTRAADDLSSVSAAARMLGEGSARDRSSRRDPFVRELRTSHDGPASSTNPSKSTRSDSRPARDRLESRIAESQRPPPRRSIEVQRATPGQAHAGGPPGPVLLLRAPHRFARGGDGPGADLWREQPQARALDEESGTALVRGPRDRHAYTRNRDATEHQGARPSFRCHDLSSGRTTSAAPAPPAPAPEAGRAAVAAGAAWGALTRRNALRWRLWGVRSFPRPMAPRGGTPGGDTGTTTCRRAP